MQVHPGAGPFSQRSWPGRGLGPGGALGAARLGWAAVRARSGSQNAKVLRLVFARPRTWRGGAFKAPGFVPSSGLAAPHFSAACHDGVAELKSSEPSSSDSRASESRSSGSKASDPRSSGPRPSEPKASDPRLSAPRASDPRSGASLGERGRAGAVEGCVMLGIGAKTEL